MTQQEAAEAKARCEEIAKHLNFVNRETMEKFCSHALVDLPAVISDRERLIEALKPLANRSDPSQYGVVCLQRDLEIAAALLREWGIEL